MLAALGTIGLSNPVRSYAHGPQQIRSPSLDRIPFSIWSNNAERMRVAADGGIHIKELSAAPLAIAGMSGIWAGTNYSLAIGNSAAVAIGSSNQVAIGYAAGSNGADSVAIGKSSSANASYAVCVGSNAANSGNDSVAIGYAVLAAANQIVIGSSGMATLADMYIGKGVVHATPVAAAINATGGSGTDIAGANLTIAAGKGTGNAAGGYLSFKTSAVGTSGSTLQTLAERMRITAGGCIEIVPVSAIPSFTASNIRLFGTSTALALGILAGIGDTHTVAIGASAVCNYVGAVAIGHTAQCITAAINGIAIGRNAQSIGAGGIAIGGNATAANNPAQAHEVIFGDGLDATTSYISDFYPFSRLNTKARTCTIHGPDSNTGTNVSSDYDFCIAGARGTGTGTGGKLKLQCPVTGASGTTRQTLANVIEIQPDSKLGFFNVTPVARAAAYTPTNVSTDRSYDANATTLDELADVLGTLIADLQAYGLLQ